MTGEEEQIGGFDLIYKNDAERVSPLGPGTSRLGCLNNSVEAIKRLAKQTENRLIKESQISKSKDKSFDAGNKKLDDKRRSSTIARTPQR
jgi:tubulin polyglutamylase TTLL9